MKLSDVKKINKRKRINFKFELYDASDLDEFYIDHAQKHRYKIYFDRETTGNFMMSKQMGFRFSQVLEFMIYYCDNPGKNNKDKEILVFQKAEKETDQAYIIPVAVQYAPSDWTDADHLGQQISDKKSIFEYINPYYLNDLQNKKAILMIDQSVEGYSQEWLWDWFHEKCRLYKISPSSIIYLTGDQSCNDSYQAWCDLHCPKEQMKVIPSISLSHFVHKHYVRHGLHFDFDEIYNYKKENSDKIFLYDCLNKRPRHQRIFNFLHLLNADLLDDGNISMPSSDEWAGWMKLDKQLLSDNGLDENIVGKIYEPGVLPRIAKYNYDLEIIHYFSYVERILDDLYKNSWVSLVVESSFYEREHSVFVSEKSFKPLAAMQPFITIGSRGTLKYIRKLGFKTFHPFIDESYDDMPDKERYLGIIEALKKIKAIKDKPAWLHSMKEILVHNHNLFMDIGKVKSKEHTEISNYFSWYNDRYLGSK